MIVFRFKTKDAKDWPMVRVKVPDDASLNEVHQAYIAFLHACGYGDKTIEEFYGSESA